MFVLIAFVVGFLAGGAATGMGLGLYGLGWAVLKICLAVSSAYFLGGMITAYWIGRSTLPSEIGGFEFLAVMFWPITWVVFACFSVIEIGSMHRKQPQIARSP